MSDQAGGLLVSFGGHTLRVDSDSPQISTAMQTHLHHCRVNGQETDLITKFTVTDIDESAFMVSENDSALFPRLSYDLTLQMLMTELISRLVAVCDRGLVLHAAALAWQGNGLILCGKSSSGKSSLAAWLTAEGFQYLTDEIIELPLNGDMIHGLPRSITLKHGSAFIWKSRLPNIETQGFLSFEDGGAWIDPYLFHQDAVAKSSTPQVLVFPQYQADAPLQTQKLTTAEALFRLLEALVNARNLPGHGMEGATRLAKQVKAYSLTYSDIEEATDWTKRTVST